MRVKYLTKTKRHTHASWVMDVQVRRPKTTGSTQKGTHTHTHTRARARAHMGHHNTANTTYVRTAVVSSATMSKKSSLPRD